MDHQYPAALVDNVTGERLPSLAGTGWTVADRTSISYGTIGGRVVNVRLTYSLDPLWLVAEHGRPCEAAATPSAALRLAGFELEA